MPSTTAVAGPFGASADPVGYVVSGTKSIYFAGDTDLFEEMRELGPVDVGLIPIWGWGPGLGGGHLDPARAAEAVARIEPRLVIPIHWGTYFPIHLGLAGRPAFVDLPPLEFVAALKENRRRTSTSQVRSRPRRERARAVLDGDQAGSRFADASALDGLLADLARDVRDVGAERGVRDDVQPRRLLGDVADLDVDRELVALRHASTAASIAMRRASPSEGPSRTGTSTVTRRRGSSTERFTRIVETIVVLGTKIRRPSSVVSAV